MALEARDVAIGFTAEKAKDATLLRFFPPSSSGSISSPKLADGARVTCDHDEAMVIAICL